MELASAEAASRGGFGEERYEVSEFQAKVKTKVSGWTRSISTFVIKWKLEAKVKTKVGG